MYNLSKHKKPLLLHTFLPQYIQLSTWGRLEDTNSFYTCYMLIVLKRFLWAKQNLAVFKKWPFFHTCCFQKYSNSEDQFWDWVFFYRLYITWFGPPPPPPSHPLIKAGEVNFDYLPRRGESEKLEKGVEVWCRERFS